MTTAPSVAARARDYISLAKLKLNAMAVFAVGAGWWAEGGLGRGWGPLVATLFGAGCVACGASALNQVIERERDALMKRTADRPVAAGRLTPGDAFGAGFAASTVGLLVLAFFGSLLACGLGALTLVTYVACYTPLKPRTSLNTLVGTLPGALPPLIGAAAATAAIGPRAWFLFALIGIWQLPHFLAIAWLYREDYERGGFAMLPVVTRGSAATPRQGFVQAVMTVVVSVAAVPMGLAGETYLVVAVAAGALLVGASVWFLVKRTDGSARALLRASLIHLPIVLVAFALDAV